MAPGIQFPDIQQNRAELPHLRPGTARNDERSTNLETPTTKHDTPGTCYHRPRQSAILPRTPEIGTTRQRLFGRIGRISYPASLQTRRRSTSRRTIPTTRFNPRRRRRTNYRVTRPPIRLSRRTTKNILGNKNETRELRLRRHPSRIGRRRRPTESKGNNGRPTFGLCPGSNGARGTKNGRPNNTAMAHGSHAVKIRGPVDQRRSIRCCGKQRLKEGGDFPLSRLYNGRAPRNHKNLGTNETILLAAKHDNLRNGI